MKNPRTSTWRCQGTTWAPLGSPARKHQLQALVHLFGGEDVAHAQLQHDQEVINHLALAWAALERQALRWLGRRPHSPPVYATPFGVAVGVRDFSTVQEVADVDGALMTLAVIEALRTDDLETPPPTSSMVYADAWVLALAKARALLRRQPRPRWRHGRPVLGDLEVGP